MEFKQAFDLVNEYILDEDDKKDSVNDQLPTRKKPIRLIIVSLVFMTLSCVIFISYMIYDLFIRIIQSEEILELLMCVKEDNDDEKNKCNIENPISQKL